MGESLVGCKVHFVVVLMANWHANTCKATTKVLSFDSDNLRFGPSWSADTNAQLNADPCYDVTKHSVPVASCELLLRLRVWRLPKSATSQSICVLSCTEKLPGLAHDSGRGFLSRRCPSNFLGNSILDATLLRRNVLSFSSVIGDLFFFNTSSKERSSKYFSAFKESTLDNLSAGSFWSSFSIMLTA